MRLAERGFRCQAMTTQQQWIQQAQAYGMSLVSKTDLTQAALPFWQEGRVGVRVLLFFWPLLRLIRPYVSETAANFLAMAMTGYGFESGVSEYGALVLAHTSKQRNGQAPAAAIAAPDTNGR